MAHKKLGRGVQPKGWILFLLLIFLVPTAAFPHGKANHINESGQPAQLEPAPRESLFHVQQDFAKTAAPILERKCADCHGKQKAFPWYYSLPGVRQLIDKDIAEAKEHFDFSKGFPFAGHGSMANDLNALIKTAEKNSMPPLNYQVLHWKSGLTPAEGAMIQAWARRALLALQLKTSPKAILKKPLEALHQPTARPWQKS